MAEVLYVRLRGRVLGPFDEMKLRELARRGQLGRLHQLSADGVNWMPASSRPHLFSSQTEHAPETVRTLPAAVSEPAAGSPWNVRQAELRNSPAVNATVSDGQQWYYELGGQENGPVSRASLMDAIASGRLKSTNQAWVEGMQGWATLAEVPEFAHLFQSQSIQGRAGQDAAVAEGDALPAHLCRAAVDSRPWILTIGITTLVFAVPCGLLGLFLLITGANRGIPPVVVVGISHLIGAIVQIVAAFILLQYASRLAVLRYNRAPIVLTKALQTIGVFWVYMAILMLVATGLVLLTILWIGAFAEAPPIWSLPG